MNLLKELLDIQKAINESSTEKKFLQIKVYYDYTDSRSDEDEPIPENGTIVVTCDSEEHAKHVMDALNANDEWYQLAAEELASNIGLDNDEIQSISIEDGQEPELELKSVADGGLTMNADEFLDMVEIDV